MNTLQKVFSELKKRDEKAFIPYITAGDPDIDTTERIIECLIESGADIIELGIPFSDPMADGPTIQAASERALKNNISIEDILACVGKIRKRFATPIILFGYYNPFLSYGIDRLCLDAAESGVDGFLVVDLPPEESAPLHMSAHENGLDVIYLVAPTSTETRIRRIAAQASGFIYFVSVTGVTGTRDDLADELEHYIHAIRLHSDLPVGIGFGVSTPDHVKKISSFADAVIVGSALVKIIEKNIGCESMIPAIGAFVRELKKATLPG